MLNIRQRMAVSLVVMAAAAGIAWMGRIRRSFRSGGNDMVAQSQALVRHNAQAPDGLARRVLIGDALLCALSGAVLVVASGAVSDFTGLEPGWVPAAIGVGLLAWAVDVALLARAAELRPSRVWMVIGGNLAWVIASYGVLLASTPDLTTAGSWTVAILAEIVGLVAAAQYIGLRRLRRAR
jgi:hypothetical protein